jgi:hypothetical protein
VSGSAVLDINCNLVVGIVSETWFPDKSGKDSDIGWAIDSRVLSLTPIGLMVQNVPLALKDAPSPKYDIAQAEAAVLIKEKYVWNNAPAVLAEWTGRDDLLKQITSDWINPQKHITGLIGFGGEGKSSLARMWVRPRADSRTVCSNTGRSKSTPLTWGRACFTGNCAPTRAWL